MKFFATRSPDGRFLGYVPERCLSYYRDELGFTCVYDPRVNEANLSRSVRAVAPEEAPSPGAGMDRWDPLRTVHSRAQRMTRYGSSELLERAGDVLREACQNARERGALLHQVLPDLKDRMAVCAAARRDGWARFGLVGLTSRAGPVGHRQVRIWNMAHAPPDPSAWEPEEQETSLVGQLLRQLLAIAELAGKEGILLGEAITNARYRGRVSDVLKRGAASRYGLRVKWDGEKLGAKAHVWALSCAPESEEKDG